MECYYREYCYCSCLECPKAQKEATIEKVSSALYESTIAFALFDVRNQQSFFQTSGPTRNYDDRLALFHHFATEQLMHRFFNQFFTTIQAVNLDCMHAEEETRGLTTSYQIWT